MMIIISLIKQQFIWSYLCHGKLSQMREGEHYIFFISINVYKHTEPDFW